MTKTEDEHEVIVSARWSTDTRLGMHGPRVAYVNRVQLHLCADELAEALEALGFVRAIKVTDDCKS